MEKNTEAKLHRDYRGLSFLHLPFSSVLLRLAAPVQGWLLRWTAVGNTVEVQQIHPGVPALLFTPKHATGPLPAVLDIHGGGFGYRASPGHKQLAAMMAQACGCRVVMPDYRLLPDHPYPAAAEDVAQVWQWMGAQGELFDPKRMAVLGDSAGGALAAGLCNQAEAMDAPRPCFQMLIYPVTDARMATPSMARYTCTPLWNAKNNRRMWEMYTKNLPAQERWKASPMEQPLPLAIPPTYIETAEVDCLHDEGVAYAQRLRQAGGRVELVETKGTPHGYDVLLACATTKAALRHRFEALKNGLTVE